MTKTVAPIDIDHLQRLRTNVEAFMVKVAQKYVRPGSRLLDVAPQDHKGVKPFLSDGVQYETLDINPNSGATHIADLCNCKSVIENNHYDFVVCTEVLEHVRQPFDAVDNIHSILKSGGLAFISTPFNFRIHGPLPDCWRFTEYGLRELFKSFEVLELDALESIDRSLMPIQYTMIVSKI